MSFAENIEYLAYLYWPGLLLIMGIAFKEVVYNFKKPNFQLDSTALAL